MSSPILSNIFQHDADILEEQHCEMQWQHEEEQQLLVHLEEVAEACCVEYVAQKARKEVEAKAKEEAERQRLVEEEDKRKKLEYICQLWDKVLVENIALLEGTDRSQVMGSKCKEVTSRDEEKQ